MTLFKCDDGNAETEIEADCAEDAAQEYVDGGDWGETSSTTWITVQVSTTDEEAESFTVAIEPEEPDCEGDEHQWEAPIALVGGIEDNPGVFGHGGGVTINEVCIHCGCRKITDTWAQNPETGEQGLRSTTYEPDSVCLANPDDYVPNVETFVDNFDGDLGGFIGSTCQKALSDHCLLSPETLREHLRDLVADFLEDNPDTEEPAVLGIIAQA